MCQLGNSEFCRSVLPLSSGWLTYDKLFVIISCILEQNKMLCDWGSELIGCWYNKVGRPRSRKDSQLILLGLY